MLQYAIFPLQFAYLYSYYPSGKMPEIAADLEAKWKKTHFKDAESAFDRVAVEGQSAAGPSFFKKAEISSPVFSTSDAPATVLSAKNE